CAPAEEGPAGDRYVPNEIIVKFREPASHILEEQLQFKGPPGELTLSKDLGELNAKYGATDIRPLCRNFTKRCQELRSLHSKPKALLTEKERCILNRLKRAPRNARAPDLGGLYKIQLDLAV
ncbi:MAG: hypothetical protein ACYSR4_02270, partial [Planctomycetota bacterium]